MAQILFTGFPGFLGSALLPLVLAHRSDETAICVVQPHHLDEAHARLTDIERAHPEASGRTRLVPGDITEPQLGLPDETVIGLREVFHLAAVYDLAVDEEIAHQVNVVGTRNVLAVCDRAADLRRLQYVSTCYVSGGHPGVFLEKDLDTGQPFANHYEHTKFQAEELVRGAMAAGLPATIYRPGIVVGDSQTGETQKYDGPYFVIQFLLKQPGSHVVVPQITDPDRIRFSVVPRDFVVQAIDALSNYPDAVGQTYALTDPEAPTVRQLVESFCDLLDREPHWVRVPLRLTKAAMHLPGMERLLGFPQEALPYFAHPTVYDTSNADRDLSRLGLTCPGFEEYAQNMIDFVRAHPDVSPKAMV